MNQEMMDLDRWQNTKFPAKDPRWKHLAYEVWPCVMDRLQRLAKYPGGTSYNIDRYATYPEELYGVDIFVGDFLKYIRSVSSNAEYFHIRNIANDLRTFVRLYAKAQKMMRGFRGPMFRM